MTRRNNSNPFDSPSEMIEAIDGYFDLCEESGSFASFSGLIRHLEFTSKEQFKTLAKKRAYKAACDYAILRIEEIYEKRASLLKNPSGPIFVLKYLGWDPPKKTEEDDTKKSKGITVRIVR